MRLNKLTQKNYTTFGDVYQIRLPLEMEYIISHSFSQNSTSANIPDYKGIEDHKEAKGTMKTYLENMMEEVENKVDISTMSETAKTIVEVKEVLSDEKLIVQKGLRSLVDKDARVGYKSKTDSFYGYK
jgi:hypothetical protein